MVDLRYIIMCDKDNNLIGESYQCSEPEQGPSATEWSGGFTLNLVEAILYPDYESAEKVRNRIAKIYPSYEISVISKEAKELFVARLAG